MSLPKPKGIAARAGHWSARHRKTAIFGWLAFILIAFVVGGALGQKTPTDAQKMDGETRRAETILADAGFKATVDDVAASVSKHRGVANVSTDTVAKDGHSVLVQFDLKGDPETAV